MACFLESYRLPPTRLAKNDYSGSKLHTHCLLCCEGSQVPGYHVIFATEWHARLATSICFLLTLINARHQVATLFYFVALQTSVQWSIVQPCYWVQSVKQLATVAAEARALLLQTLL